MVAEQGGMAGPLVAVEGIQIGNHVRPQRVEVDVVQELAKLRLPLGENGLEAPLKEVPNTVVASVEGGGVAPQ
jgi:hypothetical protein